MEGNPESSWDRELRAGSQEMLLVIYVNQATTNCLFLEPYHTTKQKITAIMGRKISTSLSFDRILCCIYFGIQGIPAFRDFTIRDPRYFVILFQWKLAKKVDFWKVLKVLFLLVLFIISTVHIVRFLKTKNRTNKTVLSKPYYQNNTFKPVLSKTF